MTGRSIELSYSSGTNSKDPYSFRMIEAYDGEKNEGPFIAQFAAEILAGQTRLPVFINLYPARVMTPFPCVRIDTYLSLSVFNRALNYAALEGPLTLVAAQPLLLADALTHVLADSEENAIPKTLVMILGGYPLPLSLETYLVSLLEPFSSVLFVMAYGVAEVGAGLLFSVSRDERGRYVFLPRSSEVRYQTRPDGRLRIGLGSEKPLFDTGDYAEELSDSQLIISPSPKRYAEETLRMIETWDTETWRRRTGMMFRKDDRKPFFQLRKGIVATSNDEVEFWDFCRITNFCWTQKPDWS